MQGQLPPANEAGWEWQDSIIERELFETNEYFQKVHQQFEELFLTTKNENNEGEQYDK